MLFSRKWLFIKQLDCQRRRERDANWAVDNGTSRGQFLAKQGSVPSMSTFSFISRRESTSSHSRLSRTNATLLGTDPFHGCAWTGSGMIGELAEASSKANQGAKADACIFGRFMMRSARAPTATRGARVLPGSRGTVKLNMALLVSMGHKNSDASGRIKV
jgi:hypothetical protein